MRKVHSSTFELCLTKDEGLSSACPLIKKTVICCGHLVSVDNVGLRGGAL